MLGFNLESIYPNLKNRDKNKVFLGYLASLEIVHNFMENVQSRFFNFPKSKVSFGLKEGIEKNTSTFSHKKHMLCKRNHFLENNYKNRNLSNIKWLERNAFRRNL